MEKIEKISMVCHNALREYDSSTGFNAGPLWHGAPEWERQDMRGTVKYIIDNPGVEIEDIHEKWVDIKRLEGWKKGKEVEFGTHPNMTKYVMLPKEQKRKYDIILGIVRMMTSPVFNR